jgi:hypothetical protein
MRIGPGNNDSMTVATGDPLVLLNPVFRPSGFAQTSAIALVDLVICL